LVQVYLTGATRLNQFVKEWDIQDGGIFCVLGPASFVLLVIVKFEGIRWCLRSKSFNLADLKMRTRLNPTRLNGLSSLFD
jgi:hypothetical protein